MFNNCLRKNINFISKELLVISCESIVEQNKKNSFLFKYLCSNFEKILIFSTIKKINKFKK